MKDVLGQFEPMHLSNEARIGHSELAAHPSPLAMVLRIAFCSRPAARFSHSDALRLAATIEPRPLHTLRSRNMPAAPVRACVGITMAVALALTASVSARHCAAQGIDPVTAAQQPIPGAGHHYIGVGTETVNPADGSVTFELPIQTPQGRELSFPFAIRYSSSAPFFIAGSLGSGGWTTPIANGTPAPFDLNGWSYDLPHYTSQVFVYSSHPQMSGCSTYPNCPADYCWSTSNMSFSAFDGQSHPLQLFYQWPDPSNPDPPTIQGAQCGSGPGGTNLSGAGGGDYGVQANWGTPTSNHTEPPPVLLTDRAGTVYSFPKGPQLSPNPTVVSQLTFGALAGAITDRNGNQILLNGNGNVAPGFELVPGSYIDTLGRTIVSWSGMGNSSGDQITIAGLGTITVKWTTTTVTFPTGYTSPVPSGSGATSCTSGAAPGIPMSVVKEIDLPNLQKYSFTYGGPWGLLTKITFPGGGTVSYTWGTSTQSTAAYLSWPLNESQPYSSGIGWCYLIVDTPAITGRTVSYDGTPALTQTFQYNPTTWVETSAQQVYWTSKSTTVTTTDQVTSQTSKTTYTYNPIAAPQGANFTTWHSGGQIPVEQSVTYQDGSNHTLETENKTWADRYSWVASQTIPNGDNSHGTTTIRCLDNADRVLGVYEYDFAANGGTPTYPSTSTCLPPNGQSTVQAGLLTAAVGKVLRQTATAYHTFTGANILDDPDSVKLSDGSGALISQTNYQYDQSAVLPSGATTGLVSPSGQQRGNVTTIARWLNPGGSFLTTTYTYFDTGQTQSVTDPCGNVTCSDMLAASHTTYYSYKDTWASGEGPSGSIVNTNAYLTSVTYPRTNAAHSESFTWGYPDGLIRSHTAQNHGTTTYCYLTSGCGGSTSDPLLRLTEVDLPGGGKSNYYYTDVTSGTGSTISTTQLLCTQTSNPACPSSSQVKTTLDTLDGMGHVTTAQITSDLYDTNNTDTVTTTYDGFGRVFKVTNPERSSSSTTDGTSTFTYDALGRETSRVDSDGVSTQSWNYSANTVTYTDENLNSWLRTTDALGRLSQVKEPNGSTKSPTLATNYAYDTLGNLLTVTQNGVSGTDTARVRTFNYDNMSRLLCASNPENSTAACPSAASTSYVPGTSGYAYDANGNVMKKMVPLPNSTAAGQVTTSYAYDGLNRLIGKTSDDWPLTPASCFQYDVPISGAGDQYPVGTTTLTWTQEAACQTSPLSAISPDALTSRVILGHDAMGRVLSEKQCTPSNCSTSSQYSLNYSYDLAGNLVTYTNGLSTTPGATANPLTFTQAYDTADRLQSVVSNWSSSNHPSNVFTVHNSSSKCSLPGYAAPGELQNVSYGNALTLCRTYDSRLHITGETDSGIVIGPSTPGSAAILITGAEQSQ